MKIGKYRLNRYTLQSLYHRHVRPLWDERLRDNSAWQKRFLVLTNNFCDLSCWGCSALSDRPFGSNPFRAERYTQPVKYVRKFLDLIDGYRPKYWLRLSGGESSLCGPEYLKLLTELSHEHNRNISLLTNGARADEIDPHWFDFIHLDEHIVNKDKIYSVAEYYKSVGFKRFQILTTKIHRDLGLQRKHHITKGLRCEAWLEAISLWRDTVYPCCVLPFLDGWNNNTVIRDSLIENGWSINNPDLVDTIKRYVHTIPDEVVYACRYQCWKDGPNIEYHPVSD